MEEKPVEKFVDFSKLEREGSTLTELALRQTTINQMQQKANSLAVSNFNMNDADDSFAMMVLECGKPVSIWDDNVQEVDAVYLHVRESEQFNRSTGEIEGKQRVSIVDAEGTVYCTNSPIASRVALALLSSRVGLRKFAPPLRILFSKAATGSGGKCLTMSVDMQQLAEMKGFKS